MRHVIPESINADYKFTPEEVRRLQMIAEHYKLTIAQVFNLYRDMVKLTASHALRTMACDGRASRVPTIFILGTRAKPRRRVE